jgi:hypothetical protein
LPTGEAAVRHRSPRSWLLTLPRPAPLGPLGGDALRGKVVALPRPASLGPLGRDAPRGKVVTLLPLDGARRADPWMAEHGSPATSRQR